MRKQKKGYLLWEAALGILLLGSLYLLTDSEIVRDETIRKAQLIGKDAADIVHAIDKRVVLDSRINATYDANSVPSYGDWDATWIGIDAVKDMLSLELVGYQNLICGNLMMGWKPRFTANDDQALVPCELTQGNFATLGFEIDAERVSTQSNPEILSKWSITLFHSGATLFDKYAKYYDEVVKGFKLNDILKMAGQHRAFYVDRTTGNEISQLSECITYSTSCGIRFEFYASDSVYDNEDGELRADRAMMMDDLTFRVSASTPEKCYKPTPTGYDTVNCGMDFEVTDGKLEVNANKVSGDSFKLILEELNKNSPVSTVCYDPSAPSVAEHCGLSVIGGGAGAARAYFDRLYADILRFESLETTEFEIRDSLDTSDARYVNGVTYSDTGFKTTNPSKEVTVSLENGIDLDSSPDNLPLLMTGDDITLSSPNIRVTASNTYINSTSLGDVTQLTSYNQNQIAKNSYFSNSGKRSALVTKAAVLSGVKIVGIDVVNSGSSVRKKQCPAGANGTPPVRWNVFPAEGFYTDRMHHNYDWGRCSPTGRNNGTGAKAVYATTWRNTLNFRMSCDLNRNMKVDIGSRSSANSITPVITFDVIGKSGRNGVNYDEIGGVLMNVIQYCDYTK